MDWYFVLFGQNGGYLILVMAGIIVLFGSIRRLKTQTSNSVAVAATTHGQTPVKKPAKRKKRPSQKLLLKTFLDYYPDASHSEIADAIGVPRNTVRKLLNEIEMDK